jgi:hypothetical protein
LRVWVAFLVACAAAASQHWKGLHDTLLLWGCAKTEFTGNEAESQALAMRFIAVLQRRVSLVYDIALPRIRKAPSEAHKRQPCPA